MGIGLHDLDALSCYVTNEDEAFFIMQRIHSGEDKGRGVKEWTSREKEIFKVRHSNTKTLQYLIDYYIKKYFDGFDITSILPFTTIQRIFNNREVKKKIGLNVMDEDSFTKEKMLLVINASKWVVEEANSKGIAVTRLFNKARSIENEMIPWIERYYNHRDTPNNSFFEVEDKSVLDNIQNGNNLDGDMTLNPINGLNESQESFFDANSAEKQLEPIDEFKIIEAIKDESVQREGNGGAKNLPYFFQGLNYGSLNPNDVDTHGIAAVCRELQLFSDKRMVEKYPLSAAFLTRSIIEHSIIFYSKKHKIQGQNKYIWENIRKISKLNEIIKNYNKNLPNYYWRVK